MDILRTPAERFANLEGYPFEAHYVDLDGIRMHYIDEGENEEEVLLLLHGEPSWSYLYRKMIPVFKAAGFRVIAPDLIGFGKSDKLVDTKAYSYQKHMDWLSLFFTKLGLDKVTLFAQDWGGLLGLRLAVKFEQNFKRIVVANTGLPTGYPKPSDAFLKWQQYSQVTPVFRVGKIINGACVSSLSDEVIAAYNAPFPEETYKAAARIFPALVPTTPDDPEAEKNRQIWEVLSKWEKPFLTAFSDSDPITAGADRFFQKIIPGANHNHHVTIKSAGHFLQEDKGEEVAIVVRNFIVES